MVDGGLACALLLGWRGPALCLCVGAGEHTRMHVSFEHKDKGSVMKVHVLVVAVHAVG